VLMVDLMLVAVKLAADGEGAEGGRISTPTLLIISNTIPIVKK